MTSLSSASRRARRRSPGARSTGRWTRRSSTCCTATCWRSSGQRPVRARLLRRRRPEVPAAGPHHQRVRLAQPVLPQPVHRRSGRGAGGVAAVHGHRRAELQGRSEASRDDLRRRDRGELREEAGADRRLELRGRDEEVDLQRAQLPPAAAERAVDALFGQRRRERATWRCSSACRAPGRRRSRAIPSAC